MRFSLQKKIPYWLLAAAALPVGAWLVGRWVVGRAVRRAVANLFAPAPAAAVAVAARVYQPAQLAGLPDPVQRYFRRVLRPGQPYLRYARLRHDGQFKAGLDQAWRPIIGEQYFRAEPPGFLWRGTTTWFTACDQYVAGRGALTVWLLSALPIVRARGPIYDQGDLVRWLAESVWFPTSLLPGAGARWTPVDDHSATLTLTDHGLTVIFVVHFNAEDEIERCETHRYRDATHFDGWVTHLADYRAWHGLRIPTQAEVAWVIDGIEHPYARFTVREIEYDQPRMYA